MAQRPPVLVLLLLFLLGACFAQLCNYSDCNSCATDPACSWCSLELECTPKNKNCSLAEKRLDEITFFSLNAHLTMDSCFWGTRRVDTPARCPRLNLTITQDGDRNTWSYDAVPQYEMGIPLEYSPPNFPVVGAGAYFVEAPPQPIAPRLLAKFYYLNLGFREKFLPYKLERHDHHNHNTITFTGLSIIGDGGRYRLGYSVVFNDTKENRLECAFVATHGNLNNATYYSLIYRWFNILGFLFFFVGVIPMVVSFMCCSHKLKDVEVYAPEESNAKSAFGEEEPENTDLDNNTETSSSLISRVGSFSEKVKKEEQVAKFGSEALPTITERKFMPWIHNDYLEMILSLFLAPHRQIISQIGTESYYFFKFQHIVMIIGTIMTALSLFVLLPLNLLSHNYAFFEDFAHSSFAAMSIPSRIYSVPDAYTLVQYCVFTVQMLLVFLVIALSFRLSITVAKGKNNFASLFAVRVKNMSREFVDNQAFKNHFKILYGSEVVEDAYLAWDHRVLRKLMILKHQYEKALAQYKKSYRQSKLQKRPLCMVSYLTPWKRVDAINHYENLLADIKSKMDECAPGGKKVKKVENTGFGFVIFKTKEATKECLKTYNTNSWREKNLLTSSLYRSPVHVVEAVSWKVEAAPNPDDIIWANLRYKAPERFFRWLVSHSLWLLFLIFMILSTFGASLFQLMKNELKSFNFFIEYGLYALLMIVPKVIAAVNTISPSIIRILSHFERHQTKVGVRRAALRNTVFFMFLNTLVIPQSLYMTFNLFSYDAPFNSYHLFFNIVGIEAIDYMLSQTFLTKGLELLWYFGIMLFELITTGKMTRPMFDYEMNYGLRIVALLEILFYGSVNPILAPFALVYLILTFYLDKWLLLYLYEKSSESDGRYLREMQRNLFYYLMFYPVFLLILLFRSMTITYIIFLVAILALTVVAYFVFTGIERATRQIRRVKKHVTERDIFVRITSSFKKGAKMEELLLGEREIDKLQEENVEQVATFYRHPLHSFYVRE